MQKIFRCAILAACVASASAAFAGELKLTIANGRATLIATDVPARQILAEWARIGDINIVNGDRVMGPNLTVQLIDRPEREVLDTVLRSVAGYVAAPRSTVAANLSVFDRILILPTSQAPAYNPSTMTTPTFTRPPVPVVHEDEPVEPPNSGQRGAVGLPPGAVPQVPQTLPAPGMPQVPQTLPAPGMPQVPQTLPVPGMPPQSQPQTLPRPGMLPAPPAGVQNPYAPPPVTPIVRPPGTPGTGRGGGPGL